MIIDFSIKVLVGFVKAVMGILPNVPATPSAVVSGGNWVMTTITSVISVLSMLLSPALLTACVLVIVGLINFQWIYHTVMWVVRKIPVINIK
jgi:hypothetical protein